MQAKKDKDRKQKEQYLLNEIINEGYDHNDF